MICQPGHVNAPKTTNGTSVMCTYLRPSGWHGRGLGTKPTPWRGAIFVWLWHSHSCLGEDTRRHIPHSTGLGSSKLHLQWSSRECRCQMRSQIRAFSQRCPVQTCTHSCCPALQQIPLPDQSSGCGVGQMSDGIIMQFFIWWFQNSLRAQIPEAAGCQLFCPSGSSGVSQACLRKQEEWPSHPAYSSETREYFLRVQEI